MVRKLKVFSGCTEFGSEVQAFKDRGHNITLLGMDGNVDIKMDIREFSTSEHYDIMFFHPPCTEFSIANYRLGKCKDRNPDLSIVNACFRIVNECNPTYWIIENPRGCLRYFIGKPQATIKYSDYGFKCMKPTDLWGNFPMFLFQKPNINYKPIRYVSELNNTNKTKNRALIPYELSLSICKSIENELFGCEL